MTGYHRKYAIHVAANWGKRQVIRDGEGVIIAEAGRSLWKRKGRKRRYDEEVKAALVKIWKVCGCICGKRLQAVFEGQFEVLRKCRTFAFEEEVWEKLGEISAATIDRVLKGERKKYDLAGTELHQSGQPGEAPDSDPAGE